MNNRVLPAFILLHLCLNADATNNEPIKIITNNWTSQIVLSNITGNIFKSMGYNISYLPLAVSDQWGALAHGFADVQIEVWEGTMSDEFKRMIAKGRISDLGAHQAKTREDWWYPAYVEDLCPGLPDWQALNKCAALFARPGSAGKGVYFAGPWEKSDKARIRALQMDFKVQLLSTGNKLWKELDKAFKKKQPIVLYNWTPNWISSHYQGRFIEFPEYSPECETDPAWGINKKYLYDCSNPPGGWLRKAAWSGMQAKWSCAYQTLQNISFDNNQIAALAALVDIDKLTYKQAAEYWLTNNKAVWQQWIAKGCTR
ncbi:ABC transporter substrate-binding protein [Psychromonas aquimarina]|uniref:ABC transporter substrate-binding protein n=1 Tax=Psychromonas aquimarina TaxID=444919 RepID=UPI0004224DB5|nr:ABC transporter substrate-binding protein [Psychromonas aquimarina]